MASAFARVRAVARGAPGLVLVLPYGPYVSDAMCGSVRRQGYLCDEPLRLSAAADEAVVRAARSAAVRMLSVTAASRKAAERSAEPVFFPLDGHYTAAGYRLFAELTAASVAALVRSAADSGTAR